MWMDVWPTYVVRGIDMGVDLQQGDTRYIAFFVASTLIFIFVHKIKGQVSCGPSCFVTSSGCRHMSTYASSHSGLHQPGSQEAETEEDVSAGWVDLA